MDANLKPIEENKNNPDNQKLIYLSLKSQMSPKKIKGIKQNKIFNLSALKSPFLQLNVKKKVILILILMKEDGQKKKGILLLKDLFYMVPIGKN